jgi:hypothetical protein
LSQTGFRLFGQFVKRFDLAPGASTRQPEPAPLALLPHRTLSIVAVYFELLCHLIVEFC